MHSASILNFKKITNGYSKYNVVKQSTAVFSILTKHKFANTSLGLHEHINTLLKAVVGFILSIPPTNWHA